MQLVVHPTWPHSGHPGSFLALVKGGCETGETAASLFQIMNMVCVSIHHGCYMKNRWDPDLPVDPSEPLSWMLNNDPQRESDLFSPLNNPFHGLEFLTCRNMWASLRFQRWGSLVSIQSFRVLRQTAFGVVMWQSLSTHGAFLCFPNTCEADWLSMKLWFFICLGKGNVTCQSRRKTYLESKWIVGLCIRETNSDQLTNML